MKITQPTAMRPRWLPILLLTALAGMSTAWAQQEPREPTLEPRVMPARNPASLSDTVRRVQRETGGQVLGAERVQFDGREINRVKVMDDRGRVRYMDEDPQRSRESTERRRNLSPREEAAGPRERGGRPPPRP